jgi:hypothetical protein
MNHIVQLLLAALMSTLGVMVRTQCLETPECNPSFGVSKNTNIWQNQTLGQEGMAKIPKVSSMRPQ